MEFVVKLYKTQIDAGKFFWNNRDGSWEDALDTKVENAWKVALYTGIKSSPRNNEERTTASRNQTSCHIEWLSFWQPSQRETSERIIQSALAMHA